MTRPVRLLLSLMAALLLPPGLMASSVVAVPDLKTIMQDPDWIGPPVEAAWWQLDGSGYRYRSKRTGSTVKDVHQVSVGDGPEVRRVDPAELLMGDGPYPQVDQQGQHAVSINHGALVLRDLTDGHHRVLFAGKQAAADARFSADGSAVFFRQGQGWWRVYINNGAVNAHTNLQFINDPGAAADALGEEQFRLFATLERERQWLREGAAQAVTRGDVQGASAAPWYLGDRHQLVDSALSPDGRWLLAVVAPPGKDNGKADEMPHYVTASGYVEVEDVRRLVGRDSPRPQSLWLLDLQRRERHVIELAALPGLDEDPLADLKTAQELPLHDAGNPRPVTIEQAIWHEAGGQVLIQVHSIDNKDRWSLKLDASSRQWTLLEHLHDPAWINWQFNQLGWLPGAERAWWLSEATGFSHLYFEGLDGGARPITEGDFEITQVAWLPDGNPLVLSNRSHPTEYDVYRVSMNGGGMERISQLRGVEDFAINPVDGQVLLRHSATYRPAQAAVLDLTSGDVDHATDTLNAAYTVIGWQLPEWVAVPSRHGADRPIWSKFYPARTSVAGKNPIVVFVHGAGYTQNTHHKFPHYFREQMFHNLLTARGYHVLDMDYRASRGYGRDWRTAIYRQMGTPELEDLIDGVRWLVNEQNGDPDRVGLYGGSYGGFMTFMAMFKAPEVFAAGAALRPVTDWRHYNHSYTANILNTPQVDPEAHRRSSPIEFVEGLEGALLISHGMLDDNVFYKDSVRLAQRLIELEKENWELASYPLEPHGYVHPESWLDQYRRILKLFEETFAR